MLDEPTLAPRVYIRPVGRLPGAGPTAKEAPRRNGERVAERRTVTASGPAALAVAGRDDLRFAAAEVIERDGDRIARRLVSAADLGNLPDPTFVQALRHLQRTRAPIAGVTLDRPRIMGIVNVTPDSFSDGGFYLDPEAAIAHGLQLEEEGADILDVGGESTRPGAEPVSIEEECRRVLPVLKGLAARARVPLSIDSRNADVTRRAIEAGARIINEVSALTHDPSSLDVAAASGLPVVLMHAQGDPRTMQRNPTYSDVVLDVYDALDARIAACEQAGIPRERLLVDPGIGFGKTLAHNLSLLGALSIFHGLGCAVLLGASRKSFVTGLTGTPAADRLPGSLAAALQGIAQGVQIVRVHDVAATRQAIAVWQGAQNPPAS